MRALVILEHHFFEDPSGNVWCDRVVDYSYIKRYLNVFDDVIICARKSKVDSVPINYLLASGKNVSFESLPEFLGPKGAIKNWSKIKGIITNAAKNADCILLRAPSHISLISYKQLLKLQKPLAIEFAMAADKMIQGNSAIVQMLNKYFVHQAQRMCLRANGVAYVTENILQKTYPSKGTIFGESNKFFTESYSNVDLYIQNYRKKDWKLTDKPETFIVTHTGYMDSYRKGQDVLIKAVKAIINCGYKIQVKLIGDGPMRGVFEKLAYDLGVDNYVEFYGKIQDKALLLDVLSSSHLFVLPTQSEGLPRSILEAMSVGLPCIASPVDGIPELIDKKYLVHFKDINGYAEKIIEVINDWPQMINMSNENYNKALLFNHEVLSNKRNLFYNKLKNLTLSGNNVHL